MISVENIDSESESFPNLIQDDWNMIKINLTLPPSILAMHLLFYSDDSDDNKYFNVDCTGCETWILDEDIENNNDLGSEVPSINEILELDYDNPAIISRESKKISMVILVMPKNETSNIVRKKMNLCFF